jgi:hypothetical protein
MFDSEFIGVMPVRQDIEVLPADKPAGLSANKHLKIGSHGRIYQKGKIGWTVKEKIGIAIVNPRGVAAGRKNTIVGE